MPQIPFDVETHICIKYVLKATDNPDIVKGWK